MTDIYVFRLIEDGRVAITAVVHVDDIFAVGQKERCNSNELTWTERFLSRTLVNSSSMEDASTRGIAKEVL